MTTISNFLSDIDELKLEIIHLTSTCLIREPRMTPIKDSEEAAAPTAAGPDDGEGEPKPAARPKDDTTTLMERIRYLVHAISLQDGEYVPKLTLYLRHELNLRTIPNFLMALCAREPNCLPTYVCYLEKLLVLPSDWLSVANFSYFYDNDELHSEAFFASTAEGAGVEFAAPNDSSATAAEIHKDALQHSESSSSKNNKKKKKAPHPHPPAPPPPPPPPMRRIPNSLRLALKKTFCLFDEFALAKYNNEKSVKRHRAKGKATDEESNTFTFKALIRLLHISTPVYNVCCILGKRYPSTLQEFREMGLDEGGRHFDPSKAGQRMALEQPLTWERALSARGNTGEVWDDLFSHNAVPFMATLRNLRNIVLRCGSDVTHQKIVERLSSEEQVAQSKQFPYRFYSAREALLDLDELVAKEARRRAIPKKKLKIAVPPLHLKGKKRPRKPPVLPAAWTEELDRRRQELLESLDAAVSISTKLNIPPMKGTSLVILSLFPALRKPMGGSGAGKKANVSKRTQLDAVALLVSMMFRACEKCVVVLFCLNEFVVYNPSAPPIAPGEEIPPEPSVLARTNDLVQECKSLLARMCEAYPEWAADTQSQRHQLGRFPFALLDQIVTERQPIESFVVLDEGHHTYSCMNADAPSFGDLPVYLERLRRVSSPNLVYVGINVGGRRAPASGGGASSEAYLQSRFHHRNDFLLSGFSDAILKLIAERTGGGPQEMVERADVTYHVQRSSARLTNEALEQKRKVLSLIQRLEQTYDLPEHLHSGEKNKTNGAKTAIAMEPTRNKLTRAASIGFRSDDNGEDTDESHRHSGIAMAGGPLTDSGTTSSGLERYTKPLSRGPAEEFYALHVNNSATASLLAADSELPTLPCFDQLIVRGLTSSSSETDVVPSAAAAAAVVVAGARSASPAGTTTTTNRGALSSLTKPTHLSAIGDDRGVSPLVLQPHRTAEKEQPSSIERRFLSSYRLWRFFISSTFLDMNSERNALTLDVFPRLRRWIADRGLKIHLLEVDLRWGITLDATTKNLSTSVCLNEVARCSPFFIGLLGSRYGSIPNPLQVVPDDDVSLADFDWLKHRALHEGCSVTELEVKQAVHSARLRLTGAEFPSSMLFFVRDEKHLAKSLTSPVARQVYAPDTPTTRERIHALEDYLRGEGMSLMRYKCAVKEDALAASRGAAAAGAGLSGMLGDGGLELPPLTDETDVGVLLDHPITGNAAGGGGRLRAPTLTSSRAASAASVAAAAPTSKDVPLDMTDFAHRAFVALRRAISQAFPLAPQIPAEGLHPRREEAQDTTPFGSRSGSPSAPHHLLMQEMDSGSFTSHPPPVISGAEPRTAESTPGRGVVGPLFAGREAEERQDGQHPHKRLVRAKGNASGAGQRVGGSGASGRQKLLSSDYYASLYMDNMTFMQALSSIYVPPRGLVQQLAAFACSVSSPSLHFTEKASAIGQPNSPVTSSTVTTLTLTTTARPGAALHGNAVDSLDGDGESSPHVLLVTAHDGNGKSSALAALAQYLLRWSSSASQVVVYYSFQGVGVSALRAMLFYMATTLVVRADLHGAIFIDEGTETEGLLEVLSRIGAELSKKQRSVVVIIDAADYSEDPNEFCRCFQYLHSSLVGRDSRFVVSAAQFSHLSQAMLERFSFCQEVVIPVLSEAERADVVRRHLATYGKRLQETWDVNELQGILRKQESGKVSYLIMALMHLRLFSTFDTLRGDIKRLPGTTLTLFPLFFQELESRFDHDTCFAVFTSLYLRHSMGGIMEYNLYRLMDNVAAATRLVALLSGTCLVSREGRVAIRTTVFYNAIRETYFRQASSFVRTSEQMLVAELLGEPITTKRDEMRIKNVIRSVTTSMERATREANAPPCVFQPSRCSPQELLGILQTSVQAGQHELTLVLISYFPFLDALLLDTVVFHRFLNFLSQLRSGSATGPASMGSGVGAGGAAVGNSNNTSAGGSSSPVVAGSSVVVKAVQPIMQFLLQHYHILSVRPDLLLQCLRNMPPSFTAIKEVKATGGAAGSSASTYRTSKHGSHHRPGSHDNASPSPHRAASPSSSSAAAAAAVNHAAAAALLGLGAPVPPSFTVPLPSAGILPSMEQRMGMTDNTDDYAANDASDNAAASWGECGCPGTNAAAARSTTTTAHDGLKGIIARRGQSTTWVKWANQQQHGGEARQAILSPSSQPVRFLTGCLSRALVAYSCEELVVRVCMANDLRQTAMASLTHASEVTAAAFVMGGTPASAAGRRGDEDTLMTATADGKLWLWDLESGALRFAGNFHTRAVTALAAHPKDTVVVSASLDTYCVVWDCHKHQGGRSKLRQQLEEILDRNDPKHRSGAFRTKGLRGRPENEPKLRPLVPLLCLRDHDYPVASACFHKAGAVLATGAWNGKVMFYDFGRLTETIAEKRTLADCVWRQAMRVSAPVRVLCFFPSMVLTCAVGRFDGLISLLDVASLSEGGCVTALHHAPVAALGFSADGKLMASADITGVVRVSYAGLMGTLLATFNGHRDHVTATLFIGPGASGSSSERLVTSSLDQTIQVWGVNSDEKPALTASHSAAVTALTCTDDGKTFVTGGDDGQAFIFTLEEDVGEYYKRCRVGGSGAGSEAASGLSVYATQAASAVDYRHPSFVLSHDGKAVTVIRFALRDSRLLTGVSSGEVYVWSSEPGLDRRSGRLLYRVAAPSHGSYPIVSLECVEDFHCGNNGLSSTSKKKADGGADAADGDEECHHRALVPQEQDEGNEGNEGGLARSNGRTARVVAICANAEAVTFDLYSADVSLALLQQSAAQHGDTDQDNESNACDSTSKSQDWQSSSSLSLGSHENKEAGPIEGEVAAERKLLEKAYRVCRRRLRWLRPCAREKMSLGPQECNDHRVNQTAPASLSPQRTEEKDGGAGLWTAGLGDGQETACYDAQDDEEMLFADGGHRRVLGDAQMDSEQMKAYLYGEELIGVLPLRMEGRLQKRGLSAPHRENGMVSPSTFSSFHKSYDPYDPVVSGGGGEREGVAHLRVDITSHLVLLVGRTKLFLGSVLTGCITEIAITSTAAPGFVGMPSGTTGGGWASSCSAPAASAASILQSNKEEIFSKVSRAVPRPAAVGGVVMHQSSDHYHQQQEQEPLHQDCNHENNTVLEEGGVCFAVATSECQVFLVTVRLPRAADTRVASRTVSLKGIHHNDDDDEWDHQMLHADQVHVVAERLALDGPAAAAASHKAPSHRKVTALDLALIPPTRDTVDDMVTDDAGADDKVSGTLGLLLGGADGASHLFAVASAAGSHADATATPPPPSSSSSLLVAREIGTFFAASTLTACVVLPPFGKGTPPSYHQRRAQAILRSMGLLADKALRQMLAAPLLHWVTGDSLGNIYQLRLVREAGDSVSPSSSSFSSLLLNTEKTHPVMPSTFPLSLQPQAGGASSNSSKRKSATAFLPSADAMFKPLPSLAAMQAVAAEENERAVDGRVRTADGFFASPPPLGAAVRPAGTASASAVGGSLGLGQGPLAGWEDLLVGRAHAPSRGGVEALDGGSAALSCLPSEGILPLSSMGGGATTSLPFGAVLPALPPGLSTLLDPQPPHHPLKSANTEKQTAERYAARSTILQANERPATSIATSTAAAFAVTAKTIDVPSSLGAPHTATTTTAITPERWPAVAVDSPAFSSTMAPLLAPPHAASSFIPSSRLPLHSVTTTKNNTTTTTNGSSSSSYFSIIHEPLPSSLPDQDAMAYLTHQQEVLREALRVQHYNEDAKAALRRYGKLSGAATLARMQSVSANAPPQ